jgi:metastasis-associated protein MTA
MGLNALVSAGQPPAKRSQHIVPSLHGNMRTTHEHSNATTAVVVAGTNSMIATASATLPSLTTPLNGRASHSHTIPVQGQMSRSNARKQVMSWMDAPDDVYFRATDQTKYVRLMYKICSFISRSSNLVISVELQINFSLSSINNIIKIFFYYRRLRRSLSSVELRRAARKPWRRLNVPMRVIRPDDMVVILD